MAKFRKVGRGVFAYRILLVSRKELLYLPETIAAIMGEVVFHGRKYVPMRYDVLWDMYRNAERANTDAKEWYNAFRCHDGRRYVDLNVRYLFKYLGAEGCGIGDIAGVVVSNDLTVYPHLGEEIHWLKATVFFGFRPGSDEAGRYAGYAGGCIELHPRYGGTEEQWENLMMDVECGDLVVRFSRGGRELEPLWTAAMVRGAVIRLEGERIDWDVMEREEAYWKEAAFYDGGHDGGYDTDALLLDAYEGDIEDYWISRL